MKTCVKCKTDRDDSDFYVRSNGKMFNTCKYCQHEYDKQRAKQRSRLYYEQKAKNKIQKYDTTTGEKLKQCSSCRQWKKYSEFSQRKNSLDGYCGQCIECVRKRVRNYNEKLSLEEKEKRKADKIEYMREYRKRNREMINKKKLKESQTIQQNLNHVISSAIYRGLFSSKIERHWEDLVSYTLQELKEHLEKQFDNNMTWDNYGSYWEIDHIIPQNTFNFTSYEDREFQICWSLANLRPLEKSANRSRPKDGSDISEELKQKILGQKLYYDII